MPRGRNDLLEEYPHPGKFEGSIRLAEYLYGEDFPDEETGDVQENGTHYSLFLDLDKDRTLRGRIGRVKAAILSEDQYGFVSVDTYESKRTAMDAWGEIEDEVSEFYDEYEFDDDEDEI